MSDKCKELIYGDWGRSHQCNNKAKKDGYCGMHHPDAKAARQAKSEARWNEKQKNSTFGRLEVAYKRIASLEAQLKERESDVDKLLGVLQRRWISVEDRLPAEEARVSISDGGITGYGYINQYTHEFNVGPTNDTVPFTAKWITHWMPLPSPPQEQDNE